jgi:hypothetical protein
MWKECINEIISELNQIQELPTTGILAGGAIANKIWESVSGNKAVINDIDIFVFKSIKSVDDADIIGYGKDFEINNRKCFTKTIDEDLSVIANTSGYYLYLNYCTTTKSYYRILDTERNDDINTVFIESNDVDPDIIIHSFDLNCVQVGYDLESKKLYYTKEFEEFINTGIIKIVNINTPSHTLIRMLCKRDVMNAKFDDAREISYLKLLHNKRIKKNVRYYFSDKYLETYEKYRIEINSYGFDLETLIPVYDTETLPPSIYTLVPLHDSFDLPFDFDNIIDGKIVEYTPPHIYNLHCLNFYYKCIYGNKELTAIWEDIGMFWVMGLNYTDGYSIADLKNMPDELNTVSKWIKDYPLLLKALYGQTLKQQLRTLSILSEFMTIPNYEWVSNILKISTDTFYFDNMDDAMHYFAIMRIKNRKRLADMANDTNFV